MLTLVEVANWLKIHPNTLRRWANSGKIRSYRISSRGDRRFEEVDIRRFLTERSIHCPEQSEPEVLQLFSR